MIWMPRVAHMRAELRSAASAPGIALRRRSAGAHRRFSSPCRAPAESRTARSTRAAPRPRPRWFPARRTARGSGPSRRRPASASSSPAHDPRTTAMKTAIELDQLAEMRFPLSPPTMRTALARTAPQARRQHPPPQRFVIDGDPVLTRQMLGRQRRARSARPRRHCISPARSPTPASALFAAVARFDASSGAAMFEALGALRAVPSGQPLRLAIAHIHQRRRPPQRQRPRRHPRQDPRPLSAPSYSSPSAPIRDLLGGRQLRGTFLTSRRGDTTTSHNRAKRVEPVGGAFCAPSKQLWKTRSSFSMAAAGSMRSFRNGRRRGRTGSWERDIGYGQTTAGDRVVRRSTGLRKPVGALDWHVARCARGCDAGARVVKRVSSSPARTAKAVSSG